MSDASRERITRKLSTAEIARAGLREVGVKVEAIRTVHAYDSYDDDTDADQRDINRQQRDLNERKRYKARVRKAKDEAKSAIAYTKAGIWESVVGLSFSSLSYLFGSIGSSIGFAAGFGIFGYMLGRAVKSVGMLSAQYPWSKALDTVLGWTTIVGLVGGLAKSLLALSVLIDGGITALTIPVIASAIGWAASGVAMFAGYRIGKSDFKTPLHAQIQDGIPDAAVEGLADVAIAIENAGKPGSKH
jgi:hypothetical protein